jgi:death-on-curing protein
VTRHYPTVEEVLEIHTVQIETFGGSAGVRDRGLLEAAVFRPQTGYNPDILAEAAALWESLAQNHPFVDGNKRTAIATTLAFLRVNGVRSTATASEMIDFILERYEAKEFTFAHLEAWPRQNTRQI